VEGQIIRVYSAAQLLTATNYVAAGYSPDGEVEQHVPRLDRNLNAGGSNCAERPAW
jgi:hypothetical protein